MSVPDDLRDPTAAQATGGVSSIRSWFDAGSCGAGLGSGLLGGVCCIGSALAVGASLGGLSFFTTWMDRYQVYFIAASIVVMAAWLFHLARRYGVSRSGLKQSGRVLLKQGLVMGIIYAVTLGAAFAAVGIAGAM